MCVIALRWLSLPEPFVRCAYHVMTVSITGLYRHQDCAPTESLPSHIGSGLFMCPRLCWISLYLGDGSRLSICQIMECCFNIAYNSSQLWHLPPSLPVQSLMCMNQGVITLFRSVRECGLCVSVVCAWVWSCACVWSVYDLSVCVWAVTVPCCWPSPLMTSCCGPSPITVLWAVPICPDATGCNSVESNDSVCKMLLFLYKWMNEWKCRPVSICVRMFKSALHMVQNVILIEELSCVFNRWCWPSYIMRLHAPIPLRI